MQIEETLLGGLSPEAFLRDYWQKKPLLIRQAIPGFESHYSPEELAGLSLEPDVESRLVIEKAGERPWQVIHGPQQEDTFLGLPDTHWTLLLQAVNQHDVDIASLFDLFAFIPAWRLDDIMISYAPDQGSVGPHTDNYDVFLIQAHGKRHWQISNQTVSDEDLIPGIDMRIMQQFDMSKEWMLEPGDMLYLPPNVPHHGIAQGDCITYSIGFRAPDQNELLDEYILSRLKHIENNRRYSDADLIPSANSGELSSNSRQQLRKLLLDTLLLTDDALDQWLAEFVTEPVRGAGPEPVEPAVSESELVELIKQSETCYRSEQARYCWYRDQAGQLLAYADGERITISKEAEEWFIRFADQRVFFQQELLEAAGSKHSLTLLCQLYNLGFLIFDSEL
ncbi:MAG: cupin domain-containing protein [Gammaproteobacteria bacterium]|nr:cupin domain-containing protein [Gammaproteobacteria bacterium]